MYFLTSCIVLFRSFKSRILKMLLFFCYFLPTFSGNQSIITCPISVREEPSFFFNFPRFCHPVHLVLSLLGSEFYLGCCYLKAETFPFFHLVLSLLGSQSYLGCCYLKAETFLSFHLVLSLLGSQSYLSCCYLKAEPFPFFYLVLSLLGSCFILDCAFFLMIN